MFLPSGMPDRSSLRPLLVPFLAAMIGPCTGGCFSACGEIIAAGYPDFTIFLYGRANAFSRVMAVNFTTWKRRFAIQREFAVEVKHREKSSFPLIIRRSRRCCFAPLARLPYVDGVPGLGDDLTSP
jgi:hypothetical protein